MQDDALDAKLRRLLQKHELEVDDETNQIVKYIMDGAVVQGVSKLLTKDWVIAQALQFWGRCERQSTKQRAFEFICDLLGHTPQSGKTKESQVLDVVIGEADLLK